MSLDSTVICQPSHSASSVSQLFVDTGNVVRRDCIRRRTNLSSSEELKICLADTLSAWRHRQDSTDESINGKDSSFDSKDENDNRIIVDRNSLKFRIKLFLPSPSNSVSVGEAVNFVMERLSLNFVDVLVVSFRDDDDDVDNEDLSSLLSAWSDVEALVIQGRVLSVGVADMRLSRLKAFHAAVAVKPSIFQVASSSCCVVPADLKAFASDEDLQLMMHWDKEEIISTNELRTAIGGFEDEEEEEEEWELAWVVRYVAMAKGRGVIKAKGYSLKAEKAKKGE